MTDGLLTVTEAAEQLRMSTRFVLDELRAKNLRGTKYGGHWRIARGDLDTYIEAHANVARVRRSA